MNRAPRRRSKLYNEANLRTYKPRTGGSSQPPAPRAKRGGTRLRYNTQPQKRDAQHHLDLCEINTRRDITSHPSVALPTGLIYLSRVQFTGLCSNQWGASHYLSYYLYDSTSLSCHEPRAVAISPPHDVMLAGVSSPNTTCTTCDKAESGAVPIAKLVFVLISGEHGTLFADYLTTPPLLTSDAGCNILIYK